MAATVARLIIRFGKLTGRSRKLKVSLMWKLSEAHWPSSDAQDGFVTDLCLIKELETPNLVNRDRFKAIYWNVTQGTLQRDQPGSSPESSMHSLAETFLGEASSKFALNNFR